MKRNELNSCDHFQLLIDYKIKKEKGTANTSQMLLELDGELSSDQLRDYLLQNKHFNALINTRLVRPFFGKEYYAQASNQPFQIHEIQYDQLNYPELFVNDDIGNVPVKVTLIQVEGKSSVMLQFNHIFIDNNGVKNLLRSFNGGEYDFIREKHEEQASFFKRLKVTFQLARKMLAKWYQPKAFLHANSNGPIDKDYLFYRFSSADTEKVKSKVVPSHRMKSISSLLLSSCCIALRELLIKRGEELKEFVFQQPFDLTPKREKPYILGNRFSFIHYRIPPEGVTTLGEMENELNRQTLEQIREKVPQKFLELESILRSISLRLHLWMISLPARGKMTSFAYTFIDEAKVIDQFAGHNITYITNMPPIMRRPPITIGFAYYEGDLVVQACYDRNAITREEAEFFFEQIQSSLLA